MDSAGNVYVADSGNHTIRKVTSAGVVTTLAGLAGSVGSADGTGSAARFSYPSGVAVDSAGNIYVADTYNHAIRKGTLTLSGPPAITAQPQGQTVNAGASVTFTVTAAGTAPLSYQWQKDGLNISSATNASYTITNVNSAHAGTYTVVVSNSAGSMTSTAALLTVITPPSITAQPQSQTVLVGANLTLNVFAGGTAPLSYQWRKGGTAIQNATNATLTISATRLSDAGVYTVVVQNSVGTVTSQAAIVQVYQEVIAWGDNQYGQTNVPPNLANVVQVAAGGGHCLALRADGTVVGWGANYAGQATPPVGLNDVVATPRWTLQFGFAIKWHRRRVGTEHRRADEHARRPQWCRRRGCG